MQRILHLCLWLSLGLSPVLAADYYWKGGSGNFNDPNRWWLGSFGSGVTALQSPISVDNVFFDSLAFTSSGSIIDITANASCNNMWWDPNISAANRPRLRCTNTTVNLDIFGNFTLSPEMIWQFGGNLRFKSVQPAGTVHTITTAGIRLLVSDLFIDATQLVEYVLQDDLYVDDPGELAAHNNVGLAGIRLNGGILNTNGKTVITEALLSSNNNPNRGLDIRGSQVFLRASTSSIVRHAWQLDFNALLATPNYHIFETQGSHLIQNGGTYALMRFGRGLSYDSLTFERRFDNTADDFNPYTEVHTDGWERDTFEHVFIRRRVVLRQSSALMVMKRIYLYPESVLSNRDNLKTIETEEIINYSTCGEMASLGASAVAGWTGSLLFRKITPGVLSMNNLILDRVQGDITGGRTYMATSSYAKGGVSGINVSGAAGRQMFFRASVSNDTWGHLGNWQDWDGSSFTPSTCLPTIFDDVYFDGSSFSTSNRLRVNIKAYCKAMRWLPSVPNNVQFNLGHALHVFGSLEYDDKMNFGVTGIHRSLTLAGQGDSLISKGRVNTSFWVYIDAYADYQIQGNFEGLINGLSLSMMRMNADTLRPRSDFVVSRAEFNSTQIYITVGNFAFTQRDLSPTAITYTGNATVHWMQTAGGSTRSISGGYFPNLIVYNRINTSGPNIYVRGNMEIRENATVYIGTTQRGETAAGALHILGGLNGATGNLSMAANSALILTSFGTATTSYVDIAGDLNVQGTCQKPVNIITHNGNPLPGRFVVGGLASINYANIQGITNSSLGSNSTITAVNSQDLGNNNNWAFVSGSSQTYYWRAHHSNAALFVGDWTDPGHWTTDPTRLVGDSACIPSTVDDVIFDQWSLSPTSNQCNITSNVRCRDITVLAAARLSMHTAELSCRNLRFLDNGARWDGLSTASNIILTNAPSQTTISGNLELPFNMTQLFYRGTITMTGSGQIYSRNNRLEIRALIFDNPSGVWHLMDDLHIDNDWAGTNIGNRYSGQVRFVAGELYLNDYDLTLGSYFISNSTNPRILHLGSGRIINKAQANYSPGISLGTGLWNVNATNFTLNFAPGAELVFGPCTVFPTTASVTRLDFFMGNLNYPRVRIVDNDQPINLYGNANYNFLELEGNVYVDGNNSFDSLRLEGGYFYRFRNGRTQTLNAPHGRIIANGTGSAFVNMESSVAGAPFTLRKPYGPAFCIDFVKVRDCIGQKESNLALVPTSPVDYVFMHPFLEFQTGVNSDNIGGTATGIWAFNLPVLVSPQQVGPNNLTLCRTGGQNFLPLSFTGTAPYRVDYTWTDASSNTGMGTVIVNDDDNDPATPYTYSLPLASNFGPLTYQVNTRTSRCGDFTPSSLSSVTVSLASPDVLVAQPRTASCDFNNEGEWLTMIDQVDARPMLSLRDSVNLADNQALGMVQAEVFFDPTVQTWSDGFQTYPYLQRHWQVRPTNNGPALVRLYFTQAELTALGLAGLFNPNISASPLDIQVRKFSGNGVGVGTMQIVPHTVIALTGANALPFSSTAGVIGIEFEVSSFSHFIITPTDAALLPLDLLRFQAQALPNRQVALNWRLASESEHLSHFELERSRDLRTIEYLAEVAATGALNYESLDPRPYSGTSYYRLSGVNNSGERQYSAWQAVEIEGDKILSLYPNPTQGGQAWLRLDSPQGGRLQVRFFDALGRQALSLSLDAEAGQSLQSLNLSQLAPGLYQVQVLLPDNQSYTQFLRVD